MYYLPDYNGGSIVNLMSSISKSLGGKPKYRTLKILPPRELDNSKNTVLMVIDGLGLEFLKKNGKGTVFEKYLRGNITSVFPPTTAAAITTFKTGVAPQQHTVTSWFMNLKEIGVISAFLPFKSRSGNFDFSTKVKMKDILSQKNFFDSIKVPSFMVTKKDIVDSAYSKLLSGKSQRLAYKTLEGFFRQIKKVINSSNRKKFIYAYWPEFDIICHKHGVKSKKAKEHFRELNRKLSRFIKNIEGTDTTLIITADHGLIDCKTIYLEKHPKLKECLSLPLCGEPRTVYCYVHPSKAREFEKYVGEKLKKFCYLYKSEELVRKNYFGLFKPNKRIFQRIGDYTLIMKENYMLKDKILGEKSYNFIGHHGGVSKEEMIVPLIVIKN